MVFYSSRANPISTAHAAEGPSFFCRPKRRKQENGLGIACMSASLPKRDSCCLHAFAATGAEHVRYDRESIRPLLMGLIAAIFPLRSPLLKISFCEKHSLSFLMGNRVKNPRAVQPRYVGDLSASKIRGRTHALR